MVCAPIRSIIPKLKLKLGDYLSVQAHKPCSISHLYFCFQFLSFVRAPQGNVLQGTQSSVKLAVLLISVIVPDAELTVT